MKYLHNVMSYIWFNRNKADGSTPQTDTYCSLHWRLNPNAANRFSEDPKIRSMLEALLDSDPEIYPKDHADQRRRAIDLFNEFNSMKSEQVWARCEHAQTIALDFVTDFRTESLSAFRNERVPWRYDTDPPQTL